MWWLEDLDAEGGLVNLHREDVHCPACPNPETAFRIEDVGMKFDQSPLDWEGMKFSASRPLWEPVMLEHLRLTDDDEHRRVYDLCVTALMAAGMSVEQAARNEVQSAVDRVRRSMDDSLRWHL
jgi:hypothetical protein